MGSFNTLCTVSQQVIVPGVQALILPIIKKASYNVVSLSKNGKEYCEYGFAHTTCYPTAFWGYAGPMIRGLYIDYGRFEILETPENIVHLKEFFNSLLQHSYVTKAGDNSYHELPFDMKSIYKSSQEYSFQELVEVWDRIWEVAQENRVFLEDIDSQPRNLQFAVIHHLCADYLIDHVNNMKSYSGQSYEQKTYFTNYVQQEVLRFVTLFTDKHLSDVFSFATTQLMSLSNYGIGDQEGCYLARFYDYFEDVTHIMNKYLQEDNQDKELSQEVINELFTLFKTQIDHRYLHMALNMFNLKLSPLVYAGQDYANETGKAYSKMIKEVSKLVCQEIKSKD